MSHSVPTEKTNIPSSSALWAALIFVGLLIAAINFVKAESADEGHGEHHGAATEQVEGAAAHHEEAAASEEHATEATTPAASEASAPAAEEAHH